MPKKIFALGSMGLVAALALSGCAQPQEEDEGAIDEVNGSSIIDAIEDELNQVDVVTADAKDLFFDHGFYNLAYEQYSGQEEQQDRVTAEGIISFKIDGTCAFEVTGDREFGDTVEPFTYVKDFQNTGSLRYESQDFDLIDPAEVETDLGLLLAPIAGYPRSADFAGFCGVQSMNEYVDRAGSAAGTGIISGEKSNEFVADQRQAYFENIYDTLGVSEYTLEEMIDILSVTYPGPELMPRFETDISFKTEPETGEVKVKMVSKDNEILAELTLTPASGGSSERALEYVQQYTGTWEDQLQFFVETYGSGDEFIASRVVE
jgi:hypothetical protein